MYILLFLIESNDICHYNDVKLYVCHRTHDATSISLQPILIIVIHDKTNYEILITSFSFTLSDLKKEFSLSIVVHVCMRIMYVCVYVNNLHKY